jgi:hypothetical protein
MSDSETLREINYSILLRPVSVRSCGSLFQASATALQGS